MCIGDPVHTAVQLLLLLKRNFTASEVYLTFCPPILRKGLAFDIYRIKKRTSVKLRMLASVHVMLPTLSNRVYIRVARNCLLHD